MATDRQTAIKGTRTRISFTLSENSQPPRGLAAIAILGVIYSARRPSQCQRPSDCRYCCCTPESGQATGTGITLYNVVNVLRRHRGTSLSPAWEPCQARSDRARLTLQRKPSTLRTASFLLPWSASIIHRTLAVTGSRGSSRSTTAPSRLRLGNALILLSGVRQRRIFWNACRLVDLHERVIFAAQFLACSQFRSTEELHKRRYPTCKQQHEVRQERKQVWSLRSLLPGPASPRRFGWTWPYSGGPHPGVASCCLASSSSPA